MIEERFKLPIIDFVSRANEIPNLVSVVLYGSAVTGGISKKSDIDLLLLFDCEHDPELGEEASIAHEISSDVSLKHDLAFPLTFVVVNLRDLEEIESDFLWNVVREGIVVWGKPEDVISKEPHPSLKPLVVVSYSVNDLSETDKRKLLRRLYTCKNKLLDKTIDRLGPGTLLVTAEKFETASELFDKFHVKYSLKRVWGH
ncbi:nucleotidyltransferase domain-containing protein [Dehalococcoidia bacterium]|nr:nucleotidyltransferase domain-containing protein [Dehalococcoidia bacterium]